MWLILIFFVGPIIYLIVSYIIDDITYKTKAKSRKKYYGEEELICITTYNNNNITKDDIMLTFITQLKKYKQRYFNIDYKVYKDKDRQNFAWSLKTTKKIYGWGAIYYIRFHFSNGWICLSFSNSSFYSGKNISLTYYSDGYNFGTTAIEHILNTCRDEARIIWRANGNEPTEYLPFNFISLEKNTKNTNHAQTDLIHFYRNLLVLKLSFSHEELKKSYREAVEQYHPDRYGTSLPRDRENAEMIMKQVNEAYERLKEVAA